MTNYYSQNPTTSLSLTWDGFQSQPQKGWGKPVAKLPPNKYLEGMFSYQAFEVRIFQFSEA